MHVSPPLHCAQFFQVLFLLSVRQDFAIQLVVNMFEQAVELTNAYPPGVSVHTSKEHRAVRTASNHHRVSGPVRVYLPALNKCEHEIIPSGKSKK